MNGLRAAGIDVVVSMLQKDEAEVSVWEEAGPQVVPGLSSPISQFRS